MSVRLPVETKSQCQKIVNVGSFIKRSITFVIPKYKQIPKINDRSICWIRKTFEKLLEKGMKWWKFAIKTNFYLLSMAADQKRPALVQSIE